MRKHANLHPKKMIVVEVITGRVVLKSINILHYRFQLLDIKTPTKSIPLIENNKIRLLELNSYFRIFHLAELLL